MKLYMFPVAPNPTRVRLYLAEKKHGGTEIALEEVLVDLPAGEQRSPEHLARNPMGEVPVLELDDGSFLSESVAIIEYLEECHPEPPMIGRDARERARVRELDRIADVGGLMAVARWVHATNSPLGRPPVPAVAEQARARVQRTLAVLDARLADGRPFLAGERPSVADCTLAAGFQLARFCDVKIDPSFGNVNRWDHAFRARPAPQSVLIA